MATAGILVGGSRNIRSDFKKKCSFCCITILRLFQAVLCGQFDCRLPDSEQDDKFIDVFSVRADFVD
jgi:hypothetical protein